MARIFQVLSNGEWEYEFSEDLTVPPDEEVLIRQRHRGEYPYEHGPHRAMTRAEANQFAISLTARGFLPA